ncbi:hypothetical protein ANCCAN_09340, partial [Ancylostoma caninum]
MDGVPCIEDHQRVTILIRQVGPRNAAVFNRIVDRLARQRSIQDVCEEVETVSMAGLSGNLLRNRQIEHFKKRHYLSGLARFFEGNPRLVLIYLLELFLVSDNPKRTFHANFVTSVNTELVRFGELQAHRRVLGLIGVACSQPSTSVAAPSRKSVLCQYLVI